MYLLYFKWIGSSLSGWINFPLFDLQITLVFIRNPFTFYLVGHSLLAISIAFIPNREELLSLLSQEKRREEAEPWDLIATLISGAPDTKWCWWILSLFKALLQSVAHTAGSGWQTCFPVMFSLTPLGFASRNAHDESPAYTLYETVEPQIPCSWSQLTLPLRK